jgi:tetratricopeptide (TPR) repeat protein
MQCSQLLSELALQRLFSHARQNGDALGAERGLRDRLSQCESLTRVLRDANARAWLAIEVVLAGEELWDLVQTARDQTLDAGFYQPIRELLDAVSWSDPAGADVNCRRRIGQVLEAIQQTGLLTSGELKPAESFPQADALRETSNCQQTESAALEELAHHFEQAGYGDLRPLFKLRWRSGDSLLVLLIAALVSQAIQSESQLLECLAPFLNSPWTDADIQDLQKLAVLLHHHRARLDALLEEVRGAKRSLPAPWLEAADTRLERGSGFLQQADYEAAIAEFTAALKSDPTLIAAYTRRADAHRLRGQYPLALADYGSALRLDLSNVAAQLGRGRVQLLLGQHQAAIADYSAVIQLDPRNAVAYHCRGMARVDAGELDEAIDDFSATLVLDRHYPWAFHHRGDAYAAKGRYDAAISDYSEALKLDSSAALSYLRRADAYLFTKEYERAISDYGTVIRLDPFSVRAYARRGIAHRDSGRIEQAIADFNRALSLDPANASHYRERGRMFQIDGQRERALEDLEAALRLNENDPHLYYLRGEIHAELDHEAEALGDLSEAIRRDPTHAEALHARGRQYAAQGQLELALEDFGAALRINPTLTIALADRAKTFAQLGRLDEALADCDEALRQQPDLADAHLVRGTALVPKADLAAAMTNLTRAIELDPINASAHFHRGLVHARRGSVASALLDLTEAVRLDPENARTYAHRALVYWKSGRTEPALRDLAYAVQLDPRYAVTYSNLRGLAHASRGNYEFAVADFTVALQLDPKNANAQAGRARFLKALQTLPRPTEVSWIEGVITPAASDQHGIAPAARAPSAPPGSKTDIPTPPKTASPRQASVKTESFGETTEYGLEKVEDSATATPKRVQFENALDSSAEFELNYDATAASPDVDNSAEFELNSNAPATSPDPADSAVEDVVEEVAEVAEKVAKEEPADYAAEQQALALAAQRRAHFLALEKARQKEQSKAARQAEKRKKSQVADDDDDEPFHLRYQKQLASLAAAAVVFLGVWYGVRWFRTPYKPAAPLEAETVWQLFKTDPVAANRKYGNQRYFIRGKLMIPKRSFNDPAVVYFKLPGDDPPQLRCTLAALGEIAEEGIGVTKVPCLIAGEFQPYTDGPYVEITGGEFIGESSPPRSALGAPTGGQFGTSLAVRSSLLHQTNTHKLSNLAHPDFGVPFAWMTERGRLGVQASPPWLFLRSIADVSRQSKGP